VAFSESNQLIAGGCDDHRVYLWDTAGGKLKHVLQGHTDLVRYVAFSRDGRDLVTGSHDRTLRVWEATTGRLRHIIRDAQVKIQSAASFSPDGRVLAYGGADGSVKLWGVASAEVMESLPVGGERPSIVAFSPRCGLLACGTESGAIWVWQVKDERAGGRIELRFRIQPQRRLLWRVLFSPDEKLLAVCGDGGTRQIINLANGEVAYSLPDAPGAFTMAFACGGQTLTTAGVGKTILVHDAATGEVRQTLAGHLAEATSTDVSPTDDVIASSSVDGSVRLWDPETGVCVAELEPPGPYAGMKIAGASGLTSAQRAMLIALGATEA
jgi:WD40 repeat protein